MFPSFKSAFKLSKVLIFEKSREVLECTGKFSKDSWDLCTHYWCWLYARQSVVSHLSAVVHVVASYNLLVWWHMAPAGCLSCWSKGSQGYLSLITGAAEDWEKVIKGAPAPAVPWQETDQTNLCSFSCKMNVQFNMLLLTRQASPEWQCPTFLSSDFYFLLFLSHIIAPTALPYQAWLASGIFLIPLVTCASHCPFHVIISCDPHSTITL